MLAILLVRALIAAGFSQPDFAYEADVFPELGGFERQGTNDAIRWLENGWLYQDIRRYGPGPHNGVFDGYRRSLADFAGVPRCFAEWSLETKGGRSEIPGVAPAAISFAGEIGINYHFTIADDQVKLRRDPRLPIHYIDVASGVPHHHRLELYGPYWFEYLIDGEVVVAGVPEGQYPTSDSLVAWAARYYLTEHISRWDYLRWGRLAGPEFDCDRIKRFRARCVNGRLKGKIRTSLPPGTELHLTNNGDRRAVTTNTRGRAKTTYRDQSGEHTLLLLDCPQVSRIVECQ